MFHSSSQIKGCIVFHRSSQIQPKHNLKRLLKNFQLLFFPIFSLLLSSMPLFFFLFCFFVIFSILFPLFPLLLPFPIFLFSWKASPKVLSSTSESRNMELIVLVWPMDIDCNALNNLFSDFFIRFFYQSYLAFGVESLISCHSCCMNSFCFQLSLFPYSLIG